MKCVTPFLIGCVHLHAELYGDRQWHYDDRIYAREMRYVCVSDDINLEEDRLYELKECNYRGHCFPGLLGISDIIFDRDREC